MKNTLFITPYAFNQVNGGSVLFKRFFNEMPAAKIDWFICSDRIRSTLLTFNFRKVHRNYNMFIDKPFVNAVARKFQVLGSFFFFFKYRIFSHRLAAKVIRACESGGINFLWIYASHSSISVSAVAVKKYKIKYHLSIQDDVHTHLPSFESRYLEDDFKFLIENASSIDFISDEMGEYYRGIYNINAKTITFILADSVAVQKPIISNSVKRIGFAGNVWCPENFTCLLRSLKALNVRNIGIKFVVFSDAAARHFFDNFGDVVDFHETVPYDELITKLQQCDLLYLPMTFKVKDAITNQTSFPSKILTYLNAGIPILNHSPKDAVSHAFIQDKQVGYSIDTCEHNKFTDKLEELISENDYSIRVQFSHNSVEALKPFDAKVMVSNLQKLLLS